MNYFRRVLLVSWVLWEADTEKRLGTQKRGCLWKIKREESRIGLRKNCDANLTKF